MSAGAIAAAAAAAARRRREEEETMSGYSNADLNDGWEFKVLRSATGAFGKPERLQQSFGEEARAGWVLLEKFDNDRVRLKRPVSAKAGDAGLGYDPYRTSYGMSQAMMAFLIVGIALGSVAALLLAVFIATR